MSCNTRISQSMHIRTYDTTVEMNEHFADTVLTKADYTLYKGCTFALQDYCCYYYIVRLLLCPRSFYFLI